jgi:isopenicillin-N epimerase
MKAFRDEFDLDPKLIYLNSGTHSISPRRVTDAVVAALRACERNPTGSLVRIWETLWDIQQQLGAFLGARPEDLMLRPNVTSAMNDFILGVPLERGGIPLERGEILHSDAEYQAIVNICRYRAERDGLRLRAFHLPGPAASELQGVTADALAARVISELKDDTRLVVLSHVTTGHGLRLPIERIAHETRRRGILLAIDGAHATGALAVDFARLEDVDFYGGNLHKWFMGPKGTGFGWVHPFHQARLAPREAGWTTFEAGSPHDRFAPGHRFAQRHLLAASVDFAPWIALGEAFAFWRERGPDAIRARLRELQDCVDREMSAAVAWPRITPESRDLRGPLLSYELPSELEQQGYSLMHRILDEHGLQIASSRLQGRWVLRLSPHIHNTEDEIHRAAEILGQL